MNTSTDKYLVQIGKDKGAYKTKWAFDNKTQAIRYYSGLNTHSGYKKRLISPEGKVLSRTLT